MFRSSRVDSYTNPDLNRKIEKQSHNLINNLIKNIPMNHSVETWHAVSKNLNAITTKIAMLVSKLLANNKCNLIKDNSIKRQ